MALVVCKVCANLVEDFTTSSYRLPGGEVKGRVCVDCAQTPTAKEQAELEQYQLEQAELGLHADLAAYKKDQQQNEQVVVWPILDTETMMKGRERSVFGTYVKREAKPVMCTDCEEYIPEEVAVANWGVCNPCRDEHMKSIVNEGEM